MRKRSRTSRHGLNTRPTFGYTLITLRGMRRGCDAFGVVSAGCQRGFSRASVLFVTSKTYKTLELKIEGLA